MYCTTITHNDDMVFTVKENNHECTIDAHGKKGLTPSSCLLGALGSCIGVYIKKYSQGTEFKFYNFKITVEGGLCSEHPIRFKEIKVTIDICGDALDNKRRNSLLRFIKNCPIHNTLEHSPTLTFELKYS